MAAAQTPSVGVQNAAAKPSPPVNTCPPADSIGGPTDIEGSTRLWHQERRTARLVGSGCGESFDRDGDGVG